MFARFGGGAWLVWLGLQGQQKNKMARGHWQLPKVRVKVNPRHQCRQAVLQH